MIRNVAHRTLFIKPSLLSGVFDGTMIDENKDCGEEKLVNENLLTLMPNKNHGTYETGPIYIGNFNNLIASWKAVPKCTNTIPPDVNIYIAYELSYNNYSGFYSFGRWSVNKGVSASHSFSDENGQVNVDSFYPTQTGGSQIKIKVELFADDIQKTSGGLQYLAITGNLENRMIFSTVPDKVFIDVPCRSQKIIPLIGKVICAPTSVAMVLEFYGKNLKTQEVAAGVFDNAKDIYGNWAFNTAFAASLGLHSYVDYYDLGALKHALACGVPVICSVATSDKRQLEGSPHSYPSGHLVVVCGYENIYGKEYLIVNDPAAPNNKSVRRRYRSSQFERVWNGIVFIIQK